MLLRHLEHEDRRRRIRTDTKRHVDLLPQVSLIRLILGFQFPVSRFQKEGSMKIAFALLFACCTAVALAGACPEDAACGKPPVEAKADCSGRTTFGQRLAARVAGRSAARCAAREARAEARSCSGRKSCSGEATCSGK